MNETRPRYGVYAFYTNHESFISGILNNIRDADEIILCAAGSTDGSTNVIKKYINENPDLNIRTFNAYIDPWRYDDIRNIGLSLMSPSIDLCICLDIEERLVPEWRSILDTCYDPEIAGYQCYVQEEKDGRSKMTTECRIHRNGGCFWKYPVYEELMFDDSAKISLIPQVMIKKPYKEYHHDIVRLLYRYIKEQPSSWVPLWRLAQVLLDRGSLQDARNFIEKALQLNSCDKAKLYELKARICSAEGQSDEALSFINKAIIYKNDWDLHFEKARILSGMGRHLEAYISLLEARKNHTNNMKDCPSTWDSDPEFVSFLAMEKKLALEEMNS